MIKSHDPLEGAMLRHLAQEKPEEFDAAPGHTRSRAGHAADGLLKQPPWSSEHERIALRRHVHPRTHARHSPATQALDSAMPARAAEPAAVCTVRRQQSAH